MALKNVLEKKGLYAALHQHGKALISQQYLESAPTAAKVELIRLGLKYLKSCQFALIYV